MLSTAELNKHLESTFGEFACRKDVAYALITKRYDGEGSNYTLTIVCDESQYGDMKFRVEGFYSDSEIDDLIAFLGDHYFNVTPVQFVYADAAVQNDIARYHSPIEWSAKLSELDPEYVSRITVFGKTTPRAPKPAVWEDMEAPVQAKQDGHQLTTKEQTEDLLKELAEQDKALIAKDPRYAHYAYLLGRAASQFNESAVGSDVEYHMYGLIMNWLWREAEADGLSTNAIESLMPEGVF